MTKAPDLSKKRLAELYVRRVREIYPNPSAFDSAGGSKKLSDYCVGMAYYRFRRDHLYLNLPHLALAADAAIQGSIMSMPTFIPEEITKPNDRGDFDGAWCALEERICERLTEIEAEKDKTEKPENPSGF